MWENGIENLYIFQGQFFSGSAYRIYLLGNPVIWWSNLVFLALFLLLFIVAAVQEQRGYGRHQNTADDGEYEFFNLFFFSLSTLNDYVSFIK